MASKATEEQLLYAKILNIGMLIGLLFLIITFVIYAAGIMSPRIPLENIQVYWKMPVSEYLEKSGMQAGWSWITKLGYGDLLNLLPIALLSGLTIVCYLAIVPGLLRKQDKAYVILAIVEVLVLVVAASGLLGSGGH